MFRKILFIVFYLIVFGKSSAYAGTTFDQFTSAFLSKYGCKNTHYATETEPKRLIHLVVASNPPGLEARFGTAYIGRTPVDVYVPNYNRKAFNEKFRVTVFNPINQSLVGSSRTEEHVSGKLYVYTFGTLVPEENQLQNEPYLYGSCMTRWNRYKTLSAAEHGKTRIIVITNPPGALFSINGRVIGQTPIHKFIKAMPDGNTQSVMSDISWASGRDLNGNSEPEVEDELLPEIGNTIYIYKDFRK